MLYPIVAAGLEPATIEHLARIAATPPPVELGSVERLPFGQRRANAAVTLLRLGEREKVLPVFEMTDDPEALTQFIFRCRPRGVAVDALLDCLQWVVMPFQRSLSKKHSVRSAAVVGGVFNRGDSRFSRREALLEQLADWCRRRLRVRVTRVPRVGCCGNGGRRRSCARWITPRGFCLDREWFTLAITVVTPNAIEAENGNRQKENARSKSEPTKPAESRQSKPDATAKPVALRESAAEKANLEPVPSVG